MNEDLTDFWKQVNIFFLKYLSVPALLALSIKVAVQVLNKKATLLGVIVSLVVGLGFAYFFSPIAFAYSSGCVFGLGINKLSFP